MTKKAPVHALSSLPRPEIALREASEALAAICQMIDEGEMDPKSATVKALFDKAKGGLAISVDGAIDFKRGLDQEEAKADDVIRFWKARKLMIQQMREAFDDRLIQTMTEHPQLPYSGAVEGFAVRTNPPSVELEWGEQRLTEKIIDEYAIPLEFIRVKPKYEIDKVAVHAAIEAGRDIKWARRKRGKKVEIK